MQPPQNQQQQRDEQIKRDRAQREENSRNIIGGQLQGIDAHGFYELLDEWILEPIPSPVPYFIHLTPLRRKVVMRQPLPMSRKNLNKLRKLSSRSSRLLALLRAVDQLGMECPYIHQINRACLEKAMEKCEKLKKARERFSTRTGLWSRLLRMINKLHLDYTYRDADTFKNRLEAILLICRQQEFARDLKQLRLSLTK